ncbi:MAG: MoaD/ThiS family protein [Chitinophagales bacterium]|nr:MoaD/ThiS family protein [Chitinophagales bacterium]
MKINVLAFGQIADITGKSELEIFQVNSTGELTQVLEKTYPQLKSGNFLIAVNKKIIQKNTELHNEDTVALLPPFSGG